MTDFEKLLQRSLLPWQFRGQKDKGPLGEKRLRQLEAQVGAAWNPNAPDGLGGPSVEPFLKVLLIGCKMSTSDLLWLKRQLAAQIPAGGNVPCDPIFCVPYTFYSGGANMPSLNRKNNSKGHTTDNCEVILARCNTQEHSTYPEGIKAAFKELLTEVRTQFDPSQAEALAAAKAERTAAARLHLR